MKAEELRPGDVIDGWVVVNVGSPVLEGDSVTISWLDAGRVWTPGLILLELNPEPVGSHLPPDYKATFRRSWYKADDEISVDRPRR